MSDLNSWSGRLAVTGIGLVTPVGLDAPASVAALRASISRIGDLPGFQVANAAGEPEPVTGAAVPMVPGNRQGPERLLRLAGYALQEAVAQARLPRSARCALFVGTAAPHPAGRMLPYGALLSRSLGDLLSSLAGSGNVRLFETGRASVLQAFRTAALELGANNAWDTVIVGGVDSLISVRTLSHLQATRRLREGRKSSGILPGEAAGFLVLERPESAARRHAAVLAVMEAAAGGLDSTPPEKPNRAVVLGRVFRAVAQQVAEPRPLLISDLNGERQRAYEWMFASVRAPFYHSGMRHWLPAECIGDAGAASGAVTSAWAVDALHRSYARENEAVVWGSSDEGPREAMVFKRFHGVG